MLQTLCSYLAPTAQKPAPQLRTRLGVESLDDRLVPASVAVQSGVLVVVGNTTSDSIYISDGYNSNYTVSLNGQQIGSVSKSSVWQNVVRVFGNAGNDSIWMASWLALKMEAYGGSGNDEIRGNRANDALRGESGNDRIYGGDGSDHIDGGDGDDTLYGQKGSDTLVGWNGNDTLYGHDYLSGDGWRDYLYGGFGNDTFILGSERDSVFDGSGSNRVYYNGKWWTL